MGLAMESNKPKPTVSQGQCEYCLKMTKNWTTNYPKGRCKDCLEKQKSENPFDYIKLKRKLKFEQKNQSEN